ncbi:MAG: hemolysin III family protein [Bacilli bacterium]|nr:hemolysin III family protein [Bacilli bacterium]
MSIDEIEIPKYSLGEEIWNAISHGLGAVFGIVATILMLIKTVPTGDPFKIVSSIVYGLSIVVLFTISCVYHSLAKNKGKKVLRILDHDTIYILIVGSYTPYTLVALRPYNIWGWGTGVAAYAIFAAVWIICIIGALFNSINIKKYAWIGWICYMLAGWTIVLAIVALWNIIGTVGSWLLLSAGIVYSVGAIIYVYGKKAKYIHTVFHFFVLAAAVLMFFSIYLFVL